MAALFFENLSKRTIQQLSLALAISFALHLAVIASVKIRPAKQVHVSRNMIEARLENVTSPRQKITPLQPIKSDNGLAPVEVKKPAIEASSKPQQASQAPAEMPPNEERQPSATLVEDEHSILPSLEIPLAEDPTYYPATQVDKHPVSLQPIHPQYPEDAEAANIVQGEVTLLLLIDEFGKVQDISVADAKPEGYFEESAISAFRNVRFSPAQRNGRDVKSRMLIRVQYALTNSTLTPMPLAKPDH